MVKTKPAETIPALVARVQLPSQSPRARGDGGRPVPNSVTAADIARLNADRSIESKIMNQRDGWGAKPSERNRVGQVGGFAGINAGLTFSAISTSSFANSSYMRSRKVGW
jgi:hypothetical protein